jgi:hypothetical protein
MSVQKLNVAAINFPNLFFSYCIFYGRLNRIVILSFVIVDHALVSCFCFFFLL